MTHRTLPDMKAQAQRQLDGNLIILAARPSMGKTALAINIAKAVAVNEELPVLMFSMEMSASQLNSTLRCSPSMRPSEPTMRSANKR